MEEKIDKREALHQGAVLRLGKAGKETFSCVVDHEIGRGGSCIVYEAFYKSNTGARRTVRVKECYPAGLRLYRDNNRLMVSEEDTEAFEKCKSRMYESFQLSEELSETVNLTNSISGVLNIYENNNTVYIVSVYQQGAALSEKTRRSLKEEASIVLSAAKIIRKLHEKGYLYLDMKPENLFVMDETIDVVQIFDFDSLFPINKDQDYILMQNFSPVYTKGFAAMEQRCGKPEMLGKYTDVYGIGALLFYRMFGHTAGAPDCGPYAEYDYSCSIIGNGSYQDKLYPALTEFFHHTLAELPEDRYPDMEQVIKKLEEIQKLADTAQAYVHSSGLSGSGLLLGREREWSRLEQLLRKTGGNCLFVTGMGGIGKSTLVRSFLFSHSAEYDSILYLYYRGSVRRTIVDDSQLFVNTLEKAQRESENQYFRRKVKKLRELMVHTNSVLVIDNFEGEIDEDFLSLLDVNWHVIVITREKRTAKGYDVLSVESVRDRKELYAMFEAYLGREVSERDYKNLDRIIDCVDGHTLALELIAKQVASSGLKLYDAAKLVEECGFSNMSPEKVDFRKDQKTEKETIYRIITVLFRMDKMSPEESVIMRILTFFALPGIRTDIFCDLMGLKTRDDLNNLSEKGWILQEGEILSIHPVITEAVRRTKWNQLALDKAFSVMRVIKRQLHNAAESGNYPEKQKWLMYAEGAVKGCESSSLVTTGAFRNLVYTALIYVPRDREDFLLEYAPRLLQTEAEGSASAVLKVYDLLVQFFIEYRDFAEAEKILAEAEKRVKSTRSYYVRARYYSLLGDYYDIKLGGRYEEGMANPDFRHIYEAGEKSIYCIKKTAHKDRAKLLAEYLLAQATLFIRSEPVKKKSTINRLMTEAKETLKKCKDEDHRGYFIFEMVKAWYYTCTAPDEDKTMKCLEKAFVEYQEIMEDELDYIDDFLVPCANILLLWGNQDEAVHVLENGILLCKKYEDVAPYRKKYEELKDYLCDVEGDM